MILLLFEYRKYLYTEEDKQSKYFYAKFDNIYKTEERKRFHKRYMKNWKENEMEDYKRQRRQERRLNHIKVY